MQFLETLFNTLKVATTIINNAQYCGRWAVDTSGSQFINFHIVSHGKCYLKMEGDDSSAVEMCKGDMVIFPRDSHHCLSNDVTLATPINEAIAQDYQNGFLNDATGLICGYFSYHHPVLANITTQLPDVILLKAQEKASDSLSTLINVMLLEATKSQRDGDWIVNKIADAIMALLFQEHLVGDKGMLAGLAHPRLGSSLKAVLNVPDIKWTVETMANLSHMSRTAFAEQFKETVGMSPMEFVTYWRLSLAYQWLADGKETTLGAALACGYDNESSFSKAFKRVMGESPGAVRNKNTV